MKRVSPSSLCRIFGFLICLSMLVFTSSVYAVSSITPSISKDGAYTVNFGLKGHAPGASLSEKFNNGRFVSLGYKKGDSFSFTNKPNGTYTYKMSVCISTGRGAQCHDSAQKSVTVAVNKAPTAAVTSPANNSRFSKNANITLKASADDRDGDIKHVNFYVDGKYVGRDTAAPYSFNWRGSVLGSHTFYARAYDSGGKSVNSSSRTFTVYNPKPSVNLTIHDEGLGMIEGQVVSLKATASDTHSGGGIAHVKFKIDGKTIGTDASSPYSMNWIPSTSGRYIVSAVATDNDGAVKESSNKEVLVTSVVPPQNTVARFDYSLNDTSLIQNILDADSDLVATTMGQGEVLNGKFTYNVDIITPPSINDLAPRVSLNYTNSITNHSIISSGWVLNASSIIHRCPATFVTEGKQAQKSNPRYSTGDRLCLDGEKLLLKNSPKDASDSAYWATSSEYVTEKAQFSRITQVGHASFTLYSKSGKIYHYGAQAHNQNSKQYQAGSTNGPVRAWHLDKVEDLYGNSYTLHYTRKTSTGEHYLSHINYAPGAQVVFNYENLPSKPFRYDMGNKTTLTKRLANITTYIDRSGSGIATGTAVKRYTLDYTASAVTHKPLLDKITECGYGSGRWQCARPLAFTWHTGEIGFDSEGYQPQLCSGGTLPLSYQTFKSLHDVNNDGYTDIIAPKGLYALGREGNCFEIQNNWSKSDDQRLFMTSDGNQLLSIEPEHIGDFNNDGLTDYCDEGTLYLQKLGSSPVAFDETIISGLSGCGYEDNYASFLLDHNGDNLNDVVYATASNRKNRDEKYYVSLHAHHNTDGDLADHASRTFKVTSGIAQIVGAHYGVTYMSRAAGPMTFGDINGDTLLDVLYLESDNYTLNSRFHEGNQFSNTANVYPQKASASRLPAMHIYDYNKDGLDDVLASISFSGSSFGGSSGRFFAITSHFRDGKHIFEKQIPPFGSRMDDVAALPFGGDTASFFRGDINNDGLIDAYNPLKKVFYLAKRGQPDLLKRVTDGFGAYTDITYDTLHGDDHHGAPFYTPSAQRPVFPYIPLSRAGNYVKTVAISDGVGGESLRHFRYQGGRAHIQGRGTQGFEKITTTDTATGLINTDYFHQDYPLTGRLKKVEIKSTNDQWVSRSETFYSTHRQNPRFVYPKTVIKEAYQLTTSDVNKPMSVTVTTHTYDQYGSLDYEKVEVGSGRSGNRVTGLLNTTTVDYTLSNNTSDWLLGFVSKSVSDMRDGQGHQLRRITHEFIPEPGTLDVKTTKQFVGTPVEVHATTERNKQGVVTGIRTRAKDPLTKSGWTTIRKQTFFDFTKELFPTAITNARNHKAIVSYDTRFGVAEKTIDANGLVSSMQYDELGRITQSTDGLGVVTTPLTFYCDSAPVDCPSHAAYVTGSLSQHAQKGDDLAAPLVLSFHDNRQRVIRSQSYSHAGVTRVDTEYDSAGRVKRISEPFTGEQAEYWTQYKDYDALGRAKRTVGADGGILDLTFTQDGILLKTHQEVTVVAPSNTHIQEKFSYTNALGQIVRVEDAQGIVIDYTFDTQGHLATTTVDDNPLTTIVLKHDIAGNKTLMNDPSAGEIKFTYNGLGELRQQQWAPDTAYQKAMTFEYDALGRKVKRIDDPVSGSNIIFNWVWDTRKKGLLSTKSGNGFSEDYYYNANTQVTSVTTSLSGLTNRQFTYTYDAFGREETATYPNQLTIQKSYHALGLHVNTQDVTRTHAPRKLWTLGDAHDARGSLTHQLFGNGAVTEHAYNTRNGRIQNIVTSKGARGNIQNLSYTFDSLGNLYNRRSQRTNNQGKQTENLYESFGYDNLNRLINSSLFPNADSPCGNDFCYTNLGNLKWKSGVGDLSYNRTHNASVYAVTNGFGRTYKYDQYGNLSTRGNQKLTYDTFNKPTQIGNTHFNYGPDHARYKQTNSGNNLTTFYFGAGQYEEVYQGGLSNNNKTTRAYVDGILIYETQNESKKITYLHKDHQGSTESLSNAAGQIVDRMSFDAWGERRQENWQAGNPTAGLPEFFGTQRGYTGHEHLDHLGLIHMNGRVYDPVISRMLSADIIISAPYNTQRYNRYTYVLNNPLSLVDPSGYDESFYMSAISIGMAQSASFSSEMAARGAAARMQNKQFMDAKHELSNVIDEHGVDAVNKALDHLGYSFKVVTAKTSIFELDPTTGAETEFSSGSGPAYMLKAHRGDSRTLSIGGGYSGTIIWWVAGADITLEAGLLIDLEDPLNSRIYGKFTEAALVGGGWYLGAGGFYSGGVTNENQSSGLTHSLSVTAVVEGGELFKLGASTDVNLGALQNGNLTIEAARARAGIGAGVGVGVGPRYNFQYNTPSFRDFTNAVSELFQ